MESFFKISSSIDLIYIQELLLRKYDIKYILMLDFQEGYELILRVYENEIDEKLWNRWLVDYANMTKDTFMGFEEYKENLVPKVKEEYVTKEELLKQAEEIENKISQKRGEK